MKVPFYIILVLFMTFISCKNEPSLDKYFVESAAKKEFIALDLSPSMINTSKVKLTQGQLDALNSFEKMHVLYLKKTETNSRAFEKERLKIKNILKDEKYQDLMKLGLGKDGANISYVGTEDNIIEFVINGSKNDLGLGVIRIQGKYMNPMNVLTVLQAMQSGNLDVEALKPILDLMKK